MAIFSKQFEKWVDKRMLVGREISLNSKRVYVLPTKAGLAFMLLLFIILLVGINYQNNLAYGLCFLLSAVMFLTIIHTCRNLSGIKLINAGAEPIFAGDLANFRMRLEVTKGTTRQAIAVIWNDDRKKQEDNNLQLIDIEKLAGAELLLAKLAKKRGIFSPGKVHLETQFPLGLFVTWVQIDLLFKVVVYPKPIEGVISTLGHAGNEEEGLHAHGKGVDDFQGLRTYQPGDSMRLVNWKSFSKGQGLFVRDFSALAGKEPWLDFDQVDGSVEHRLSVLCFWVLKMEQEQQPYGVRLPGFELTPSIGDKHKLAALYALAMHGVTQ